MAADTHDKRVLPLRPRPLLLMVREIAANGSDASRKTRRTSTATMRSGDRRRHRATSPWRLFVKAVVLLLAGALREVATEEVVDIRPVWMPLEGLGDAGASVAEEVFRSSEVLQMYHLQVRAVCGTMGTRPRAAKVSLLTGLRGFQNRVLDTRASALVLDQKRQHIHNGRLKNVLRKRSWHVAFFHDFVGRRRRLGEGERQEGAGHQQ